MSRVYAEKPKSQRQTAYRRGSPDNTKQDEEESLQSDSYSPQATTSSREPPVRSSSGYHVYAPDRQKQEKLKKISEAEEREAQKLKEKRRQSLSSETRMLGGKRLSSEEIKQKKEAEARKAKKAGYERQLKREEYKQAKREQEEAKLRERKDEARKKADILEARKTQEARDRQEQTREARLKRFSNPC